MKNKKQNKKNLNKNIFNNIINFCPNTWKKEYVYTFKYVCIDCQLDIGTFTEQDKNDVLDILSNISYEISIDKTYVDFKGTKYKKTFLHEEGWNALREFLSCTDFGEGCSLTEAQTIRYAFDSMILKYVEQMFQDLGWNVDMMEFTIPLETEYIIEISADTYEEWKRYPGEWQTWSS